MRAQKYIERELGKENVELMRKIKRAIDPRGIMNPGKKIPMPRSESQHEQQHHHHHRKQRHRQSSLGASQGPNSGGCGCY